MYVIIALIFSFAGIFTSLLAGPGAERFISKYKIGSFVFWLAIVAIFLNTLDFFAELKTSILRENLAIIYNWSKMIWFLPAGMLTTSVVRSKGFDPATRSRILLLTTWSASILCAGFFFLVTIGKAKHFGEMKEFFIQSGYSVSILYANMIVEVLASFGLLLQSKFRSGLFSGIVLLLMMFAAVGTHIRNGDGIADSYDAFIQIILLTFLIVLFLLYRTDRRK